MGAQLWDYINMAYEDWKFTQENTYVEGLEKLKKELSFFNDSIAELSQGSTRWFLFIPELYNNRKTDNDKNDTICRIIPVALYYEHNNIEWIDKMAADIAEHCIGSGAKLAAYVLVHIIQRLVFNKDTISLIDIVIEAKNTISKIFDGEAGIVTLNRSIDLAIELFNNDKSDHENIHLLGSGFNAEETLAISIYCALRYQHSFSSGLCASVNHRGNSISVGTVTGSILGAIVGYEGIDEKWKRKLELIDVVKEIADDLCHVCLIHDMCDYAPSGDYVYDRNRLPLIYKQTRFIVKCGDITQNHDVEAIVNITDTSLLNGFYGVYNEAGLQLIEDCRQLNGCQIGRAMITKAYDLPCKYVIHMPVPLGEYNQEKIKVIESCYRSCFEIALEKGITSIAFPVLYQEYAVIINEAKKFVSEHPGTINVIKMVSHHRGFIPINKIEKLINQELL